MTYAGGAETAQTHYRVLGPLRVLHGGSDLSLGGPKQRAVLAALLTQCPRALSMSAIADAAWNDAPPPTVNSIVQVYVSTLRRMLPHASTGGSPIKTAAPGYRIAVNDSQYDLARFHSARVQGERARAAGRADEAGQAFRSALTEWSGVALADLREFGFAAAFGAAVEEERLLVLHARIEADLTCLRHAELIGELITITREHPLHEGFWAQLIVALYRSGRSAEALAAYRSLRASLRTELGLDPSETLQSLERAILRQVDVPDAYARMCAPSPVSTAGLDRTVSDDEAPNDRLCASVRHPDGSRVEVRSGGLRIGRMPDNDLVLDDVKASRQHAVIFATGTEFILSDSRSRNGTSVADDRVVGERRLQHGDEIRIGSTVLVFEIEQPTTQL